MSLENQGGIVPQAQEHISPEEEPVRNRAGLSLLKPGDRPVQNRADDPADTIRERTRTSAEAQHRKGKLHVGERIELLVDEGTFHEFEALRVSYGGNTSQAGDGVVTGHARIHGTPVMIFAQDFTIRGGSFGQAHADKIVRLMHLAERVGCPIIGLYDGGGARIHDGAVALDACGRVFQQIVRLSGVVPQISVVLGPCAGAAAYAPALTDAVFMVRDIGMMYLTGPDVVEQVTGEKTDGQTLGGADVHSRHSGVATFVHDDEESCLGEVRYLVSMLPEHPQQKPERLDTSDPATRPIPELSALVPKDAKLPYDMERFIEVLLDEDTFLQFSPDWAKNIICGLGRVDGHVVGVVANQPLVLAGVLDSSASEKGAHFVSWCDAFSIPLLTLVDVPGFMPGVDIERGGVIRHGAKLLHAYCAATVPRIQVIVRKAYGGAYIVMDSPSINNDLSYAWPSNEVAVMGAEGAVEIIHRRRLAEASDPRAERLLLQDRYRQEQMHPYLAAEGGLVHDVIDPGDTRIRVAQALDLLSCKTVPLVERKHSIPPG